MTGNTKSLAPHTTPLILKLPDMLEPVVDTEASLHRRSSETLRHDFNKGSCVESYSLYRIYAEETDNRSRL